MAEVRRDADIGSVPSVDRQHVAGSRRAKAVCVCERNLAREVEFSIVVMKSTGALDV